jgi:probable F420-dependent oxidoreductase
MPRPFRFGAQYTGTTLQEWQEFARKAEDLGFSTLVAQDHFTPQLTPLLSLVGAAAVTSRIRLAAIVLDNDFRHPAVTAKEAATADVLTGGRLEIGLGAGWMTGDYEKTGIAFDPPGVRYERLLETVHIVKAFFVKAFFSEGKAVTHHGKHYTITNLDAAPRGVQKPHPPLMIGGRQKRMLSMAAREADIVSISMLDRRAPGQPPPPSFAEKVGWVRAAAGDRFGAIEIHAMAGGAEVTDNQAEALERAAARLQIPAEDVLRMPANLIGSVDAIVDQLLRWRETCNLSYFVLQARSMDAMAPVIARLEGK